MANSFFDWATSLTRFVKFDAARAEDVNSALDEVSTAFDGVETKTTAAIKGPDGESNTAIPAKAARLNKVLTFDGSGNAVTTYAIADVATVSGIAADVTTVAGIALDVTAVADNEANINAVAADAADIGTVAAANAAIGTVATSIANVNTTATNISNVNTVAGIAANVTTVAGISANVTSVAGNATNINTCATNIADIQAAPQAAIDAQAALDSFDDRYLGPKASDPALDNDGNALLEGALYWNTTSKGMKIYNGTAWVPAAGVVSPDFTILRETATATAGQTVFDLTNTYVVGTNAIMVYQNGSRLLGTDYTETDSNTITLATGATVGDELLFEIGVVATGTSVAAGNVSFSPAGSIAATNVQAALTELDTDIQNIAIFTNQTSLAQAQAIALSF